MSKSFFSDYAKIARNSDIKYRVDIKRKRVYVPKKWQGKRIEISSNGDIKASAQGVLVNAQGFASIGKASASDIKALAQVVNGK